MDPNRPTPAAPKPMDDASIATIVRDVADAWQMPPQRLDEVTWRDRVDRPGRWSRSGGAAGPRWTRQLIGAAAVAAAATVVLSFAAVWLTTPRRDQVAVPPSSSPRASLSPTPSGDAIPSASALPQLVRNGDLPTPSRVMLRTPDSYRLVDLETGTLGPRILQSNIGPSTMLARPGGGWVCICGTGMSQQGIQLYLLRVDPNGISLDPPGSNGVMDPSRLLKNITGTFDPNEPAAVQPFIANYDVSSTRDGRYALIGRVYRDGAAGWVVGVDVLDLATLQITNSRQVVVDEPVAVDGRARVRAAPIASISADGSTFVLSSHWFTDDLDDPLAVSGVDYWTSPFAGGVIGSGLRSAGSTASPECTDFGSGPIDQASYFTLCRTSPTDWSVRRARLDGTVIDTTALPRDENAQGLMLTTQTADALFLWNPVARTISRFDFATAAVVTGQARTATLQDDPVDPLAALGRHIGQLIAPSVLAKFPFESALVASPDGRRIFALGLEEISLGSTGIDVFDASTLESIGHWGPTADFSSIAINPAGTAVYASASAGVAPDGSGSPDNGASITVFDSATGDVRLLAGQLGQPGTHDLTFTGPVVR
jgi:hypothetical protein